jgi:hypothetical protein
MGFEPTIQLPIYKLSRLAPSTTRTPLFLGIANNLKKTDLEKRKQIILAFRLAKGFQMRF